MASDLVTHLNFTPVILKALTGEKGLLTMFDDMQFNVLLNFIAEDGSMWSFHIQREMNPFSQFIYALNLLRTVRALCLLCFRSLDFFLAWYPQ